MPSGIGTDTGEGGVRYWPTPTPLPHTQHTHTHARPAHAALQLLLLMLARRAGLLATHTRPRFPVRGIGAPIVRAPRGLEEPIEPPEPESPGGLCALPQPVPVPVPVFVLPNGAGHVRSMRQPGRSRRQQQLECKGGINMSLPFGCIPRFFRAILALFSPSVPLFCLSALSSRQALPLSGGLLVADTGPVRSSAAWRWAGGNRGSLPVDDDGSGGRRLVGGGGRSLAKESQDNTGRRDGPYVNEGARGAQQYRKPGDTTQGPGRAGLSVRREECGIFFWTLCWTGTSRLDSYQDSRLLQGCGIAVWAGGGQVGL